MVEEQHLCPQQFPAHARGRLLPQLEAAQPGGSLRRPRARRRPAARRRARLRARR